MSWMFLDGTKFESVDTLNRMTSDGRDMWCTAGNTKVKVYSYYGDNDGSESELDLSANLSDCYYLVKGYDTMYVFNFDVTEFVKIDINTKDISPTISIPVGVNCEPEFGNFKLWFVTSEVDLVQSLFYYDIDDGTWSNPVQIPGKHQSSKRIIKWSKNGTIYVNRLNENGIVKFNDSTGAYMSSITTNRLPQTMYVADNREVIVSGFNGMVTSVSQIDDTSTNTSGLNAESGSVVDDGTYLWSIQPSLTRITKGSFIDNYLIMLPDQAFGEEYIDDVYRGFGFPLQQDNVFDHVVTQLVNETNNVLWENTDYSYEIDPTFGEYRITIFNDAPNVIGDDPLNLFINYTWFPGGKDFNITGFPENVFKQVDITPTYTHEYWDGSAIQTKTEPQRVVMLSNNAIHFAYNLTDSWNLVETRTYLLEIQGTGMVGTGPEKYYGETV